MFPRDNFFAGGGGDKYDTYIHIFYTCIGYTINKIDVLIYFWPIDFCENKPFIHQEKTVFDTRTL